MMKENYCHKKTLQINPECIFNEESFNFFEEKIFQIHYINSIDLIDKISIVSNFNKNVVRCFKSLFELIEQELRTEITQNKSKTLLDDINPPYDAIITCQEYEEAFIFFSQDEVANEDQNLARTKLYICINDQRLKIGFWIDKGTETKKIFCRNYIEKNEEISTVFPADIKPVLPVRSFFTLLPKMGKDESRMTRSGRE